MAADDRLRLGIARVEAALAAAERARADEARAVLRAQIEAGAVLARATFPSQRRMDGLQALIDTAEVMRATPEMRADWVRLLEGIRAEREASLEAYGRIPAEIRRRAEAEEVAAARSVLAREFAARGLAELAPFLDLAVRHGSAASPTGAGAAVGRDPGHRPGSSTGGGPCRAHPLRHPRTGARGRAPGRATAAAAAPGRPRRPARVRLPARRERGRRCSRRGRREGRPLPRGGGRASRGVPPRPSCGRRPAPPACGRLGCRNLAVGRSQQPGRRRVRQTSRPKAAGQPCARRRRARQGWGGRAPRAAAFREGRPVRR